MKRFLFHAAWMAALVAGWATLGNLVLAQDNPLAARAPAEPENQGTPESDSTPEALAERFERLSEELKELPKRELSLEALPLQRGRPPRPELRESKFFLVLNLREVRSGNFLWRRMSGADQNRLRETLRGLPTGNWSSNSPSEHFKKPVIQASENQLPDKSMVEFLTSAAADREIEHRAQISGAMPDLLYTIYAPTAEEAERRARAIVQLCDAGYSRPIQRQLVEKGQALLAEARSKLTDSTKIAAVIAAQDALLAKPSEITPDILSQLKAQKVMVAVELAGLNARVKACDAMLAEPRKLEISTLQSISDMKVKAEIERVGIKDKLEQINVFIQEGDQRSAVQNRRIELVAKRDDLQAQAHSRLVVARAIADLIPQYAFEVSRFSVGPVEWQSE